MKKERCSMKFAWRLRPSVHEKFLALSGYYGITLSDTANKLIEDAYDAMVKEMAKKPAAITKERLVI